MNATERFKALNGLTVSRKEIENIIEQAKSENATAVIFRLSKVLNDNPEAKHFDINVVDYQQQPTGLSGAQHTGDYKEALDDCGRLRKGWKFEKGHVVRVEKKEKPKGSKTKKTEKTCKTCKKTTKKETSVKKNEQNLQKEPKKRYGKVTKREKKEKERKSVEKTEKNTKLSISLKNIYGKEEEEEGVSAKRINDILDKKQIKSLNIKSGFLNTNDFYLKAPKISKKGVESFYNIVSKDIMRPAITGIFVEKDFYVGTDSFKLVMIERLKNDGLKTNGIYSIREKKYVESNYPNYKALFPEYFTHKTHFIDLEYIANHAYKAYYLLKQNKCKSFTTVITLEINDLKIFVNAKILCEALQCLFANGTRQISFEVAYPRRAILIKSKENKNVALVMPFITSDEEREIEVNTIKLSFDENTTKKENSVEKKEQDLPKEPKKRYGKVTKREKKEKDQEDDNDVIYLEDLDLSNFIKQPKIAHFDKKGEVIREDVYFKNWYRNTFMQKGVVAPLKKVWGIAGYEAAKIAGKAKKVVVKSRNSMDNYLVIIKKSANIEDFVKKKGLAAPQLELSTDDFKKMSVRELRDFTLQYYLENLKGKKAIIKKYLKEVVFTTQAGRKIAKGEAMYSAKAVAVQHLQKLIENSTYNNWGDKKTTDSKDVLGYLNFKSKLIIDGEKRHLRISLTLFSDRKTELKNVEVGKKKKSDKPTQAPVVNSETTGFVRLSGNKNTKNIPNTQENDGKTGLSLPLTAKPAVFVENVEFDSEEDLQPEQSQSLPQTVRRKGSLAEQIANRPTNREYYQIDNPDMAYFLGKMEVKNTDSLVITLTGGQGSGKTRFAFQFMNDLAQRYKVGHISIEEHPDSDLYEQKVFQYLDERAMNNVEAADVRSLSEVEDIIKRNDVIVIDSFQKLKEIDRNFEIDKDLRKKYNGKLFLVIFQQTSDGKMRGGSKSQFDGDIILFTEKFPDYRENYVYPDKNRYNSVPFDQLKYSIFEQLLLPVENSQVSESQSVENLTFDVVY